MTRPAWWDLPPFFSPEFLAEHARTHPLPSTRAGGAVEDVQAREIKRHAWHLLRRGVDPHLALELLIAFNAHRGMPPLEQSEVEDLVAKAASYVLGVCRAA